MVLEPGSVYVSVMSENASERGEEGGWESHVLDEVAAAAVDGFELPVEQASKEARGMNSWFLG